MESQFNIRSPKRRIPEQDGIHAWLPYYAAYSAAFVSQVLDELGVRGDRLLLDPMNGSGTTTVVAQQRCLPTIGIDLNPAMAVISRAKDASLPPPPTLVAAVLAATRIAADLDDDVSTSSAATGWFQERSFADLSRLLLAIPQVPVPDARPLHRVVHRSLPPNLRRTGGSVHDFLRAVLLVAARRVSNAVTSKNPTWLKHRDSGPDPHNTFAVFSSIGHRMAYDLANAFQGIFLERRLGALEADARGLPLPSDSVDVIITSPPYLTRIDYAVSTAPELCLLGHRSGPAFRLIRESLMGSTCVLDGSHDVPQAYGPICRRVLDQVASHYSKASSSYYYKTHVQYFNDAYTVVQEFLRVLKPSAPGILVVQDSWYKDIHIPLADIYAEIAVSLGASSVRSIRTETVHRHIGLRNTRARRYAKGALREHVLLIRG